MAVAARLFLTSCTKKPRRLARVAAPLIKSHQVQGSAKLPMLALLQGRYDQGRPTTELNRESSRGATATAVYGNSTVGGCTTKGPGLHRGEPIPARFLRPASPYFTSQ